MVKFPKNVFGFYLNHVVKNYFWLTFSWLFIFFTGRTIWYVAKPLRYKWFTELFTVAPNSQFMEFAFPTILLILLLNLYSDINWTIDYWLYGRMRVKVQNSISEELYGYIYEQSLGFFKNVEPGKITSQIDKISKRFKDCIKNGSHILVILIIFGISSSIMFQINRNIAFVLIAAMVIRMILSVTILPRLVRVVDKDYEQQNNLNGKLLDGLTNFTIVKMFAGKKFEMDYANKYRRQAVTAGLMARFVSRWQWCPQMYVSTISLALLMYFCVSGYQNGTMFAPEIIFAFASYATFSDITSELTDYIPEFVDATGEASQSYRSLMAPILVQDVPNAKKLNVNKGKIEIQNLSFKFKNKLILDNINLIIKPGEKVGIVGVSGAGKTTLINLLMRFFDPQKGKILIDDQNIKNVTQDSLRENIAFIPQEPTLFNRTLADNIGYGHINPTIDQIKSAAKYANADEFIMGTTDKYNSMVGDRGIKLSGGQRQRIAIARAFLKNAQILVLDEATSALDSETELVIQKSFKKLSRGRTTVTIAHRLSTLRDMDRIIVIDKGKIAEVGRHAQLLRKGGVYARLWNMQSCGFIQD